MSQMSHSICYIQNRVVLMNNVLSLKRLRKNEKIERILRNSEVINEADIANKNSNE